MSVSDALHKTVHGAPGGHAALAVRLGMSATILRNKANPNSVTNKATLDEVDRIIGLTGDAGILHALAENHGFVCVSTEGAETASDVAVMQALTKVWMTDSDLGAEVHKALEDGIIEQHELKAIRAKVYRHMQAIHQLVARLDLMALSGRQAGHHG